MKEQESEWNIISRGNNGPIAGIRRTLIQIVSGDDV